MSGRTLRKIPFLTHAIFLQVSMILNSLTDKLYHLQWDLTSLKTQIVGYLGLCGVDVSRPILAQLIKVFETISTFAWFLFHLLERFFLEGIFY